MKYTFPVIENISDVLPAIEGSPEFIVAEREGYTVLNYTVNMPDTFPPVNTGRSTVSGIQITNHAATLRRECRGIIFCSKTGEILRRPFHKFFNVNEKPETQEYVVNMSQPHAVLDKLDGSMIAPFLVDNRLIWGTKMGDTDVAQPVFDFVENSSRQYYAFAIKCISLGFTPIFEWCSRKQRIVLDYKEDQLILTAIRSMKSGTYLSHFTMSSLAKSFKIPVVEQHDSETDIVQFLETVSNLEGIEGFVVRFNDGHMLKLKADWYIQIHKAKDKLLQDRNIVEMIIDNTIDDVKSHLLVEDRERLTKFERDFNAAVLKTVEKITNDHMIIRSFMLDRKTFALEHANKYDMFSKPILFRTFETDEPDMYNLVLSTIRNNLTKTAKYEEIRQVWFRGVEFNEY